MDTLALSKDTRPIHLQLFRDLTPPECPEFAGHYRGEAFRCLESYEVYIRGDPLVGEPAKNVRSSMIVVAEAIDNGVAAFDTANQLPESHVPRWQKIYYLVTFACRVFVEFLRVHPYANGNGHMGRFLIWAILGRYGLWPRRWPLDKRPPDPPYSYLISQYRAGNREPLEQFVLRCVLGNI
jgi:fido (protein-threonine AMPylation protein)